MIFNNYLSDVNCALNQFDVVWVKFPKPINSHMAVVLSNDFYNHYHNNVIVAVITSKVVDTENRLRNRIDVNILPDDDRDSQIDVGNVHTVQLKDLSDTGRIGKIIDRNIQKQVLEKFYTEILDPNYWIDDVDPKSLWNNQDSDIDVEDGNITQVPQVEESKETVVVSDPEEVPQEPEVEVSSNIHVLEDKVKSLPSDCSKIPGVTLTKLETLLKYNIDKELLLTITAYAIKYNNAQLGICLDSKKSKIKYIKKLILDKAIKYGFEYRGILLTLKEDTSESSLYNQFISIMDSMDSNKDETEIDLSRITMTDFIKMAKIVKGEGLTRFKTKTKRSELDNMTPYDLIHDVTYFIIHTPSGIANELHLNQSTIRSYMLKLCDELQNRGVSELIVKRLLSVLTNRSIAICQDVYNAKIEALTQYN